MWRQTVLMEFYFEMSGPHESEPYIKTQEAFIHLDCKLKTLHTHDLLGGETAKFCSSGKYTCETTASTY